MVLAGCSRARSGVFTLGSLLCGLAPNLPLLVGARIVQGHRRGDDDASGAHHDGPGPFPSRNWCGHELCRDPGADRAHARARGRRIHRGLLPLASDLLRQPADRPAGPLHGPPPHARLPGGQVGPDRFRRVRAVRRAGIALLSYVLEVFGEHSLQPAAILGLLLLSAAFLGLYVRHARSGSRIRPCASRCSASGPSGPP